MKSLQTVFITCAGFFALVFLQPFFLQKAAFVSAAAAQAAPEAAAGSADPAASDETALAPGSAAAALSANVDFHISPYERGSGDASLLAPLSDSGPDSGSDSGSDSNAEIVCRPLPPLATTVKSSFEADWIPALDSLLSSYEQPESSLVPVEEGRRVLRFGFVIYNKNPDRSLLIDRLTVLAEGESGGRIYQNARILGPGYCGLPFLYFLPPKGYLRYKPFSDNPRENLTLVVDGFPFVRDFDSDEKLTKIKTPSYNLELILTGRFIPGENSGLLEEEPFFKRLGFQTGESSITVH